MGRWLLIIGMMGLLLSSCATTTETVSSNNQNAIRVEITGGDATDPRDKGRPVVLIAAALGVPTTVFREAFSHVSPAPAGQEPDAEQVRRNKAELLAVLAPYNVTNETLDRVSDYYRFNASAGETWPKTAAQIEAIVSDGVVTGFKLINPGAGYSSPPTITLIGANAQTATVSLNFGPDLATNGSIAEIHLNQ
ncbi:hypothetical protein [Herpetosiphon giganteus]|uniref:hypothetical protein n=1 Tax=Herpetosiphon giganteus TaxID=2029754 RepID=UPI00195BEFDB|nr:hypothetical protein [Herpetosiphon giganteus]MBM7844368.1 hypothetical protein [Herpetosiphon giganteus]